MTDSASFPSQDQAIEYLHERGARFIRCNEAKTCIEAAGLYDRERPDANSIIEHVRKGLHVAIEPRTLLAGVLDFDGSKSLTPDESLAKVDPYCQFMIDKFLGRTHLVGCFPSMSGYGCHAWLQIDVTRPYPLGRKADDSMYRSCTRLYVNPSDRMSRFDLRCSRSYAVCTHYLIDLAQAVEENLKPDGGAREWTNVIRYGKRGSRKYDATPWDTVDPRYSDQDSDAPFNESGKQTIVQAWFKQTPDLNPKHWNSGHFEAYKLGCKAGKIADRWPGALEDFKALVRANHKPDKAWKLRHSLDELERGFNWASA